MRYSIVLAFAFVTMLNIFLNNSVAANSAGSALIVVDMQRYFAERRKTADRGENPMKLQQAVAEIVQLIEKAKKARMPIIVTEYVGHGPSMEPIRKALEGYQNAVTFLKNENGLFDMYNKSTQAAIGWLREREVEDLLIVGANGGTCVELSIMGAMKNGFNVFGYSQATADFNPELYIYPYRFGDRLNNFTYSGKFKEIVGNDADSFFSRRMVVTEAGVVDSKVLISR